MNTIYILNTLQKEVFGSVHLIKVDSVNQRLTLEGAIFVLYWLNETSGRYVELAAGLKTKEDGSLIIDKLKPGRYKLVEIKAPDGYSSGNTKIFFSIELDSNGAVKEPEVIPILNCKCTAIKKPKCRCCCKCMERCRCCRCCKYNKRE